MISVIIPTYNRARYINECVDSVLRQTYSDYEIIIIDDGSTDDTRERLSRYGDRIRYVYKPNGGLASARNEGLKQARGAYIAWLDSDDRWLPFKLELQMRILEKLPAQVGFVHSDFSCFTDENGIIAPSYLREYLFTMDSYHLYPETMYAQHSPVSDFMSTATLKGTPTVYWGDVSRIALLGPLFLPSTVLMRRTCADAAGLFRSDLPCAEDFEHLALAARQYQVAFVDTPTIEYRRFHADQLSSEKMEIITNTSFVQVVRDLGVNDAAYYRDNRRYVDWRLSHAYYALGRAYYRKRQYLAAWRNFFQSIAMNYRQKKVYAYAIASFVRLLPSLVVRKKKENVSA